jgi:hypothetical protein
MAPCALLAQHRHDPYNHAGEAEQNVNGGYGQKDRIRRWYLDSCYVRYAIGHVRGSTNLQSTPEGSVTPAISAQPCGRGAWILTP